MNLIPKLDELGISPPETFADAITKLRTFGAFPDQARINAVVAAHEREVAELNEAKRVAMLIAENATIEELRESCHLIANRIDCDDDYQMSDAARDLREIGRQGSESEALQELHEAQGTIAELQREADMYHDLYSSALKDANRCVEDKISLCRDLNAANATIAELKAKYADACRCADTYERELSDVATQCGHAKGQIAELKEALRKIAEDGGSGCIAAEPCPFVGDESRDCNTCDYSVDVFARAALEKTEGKGEN